MSSKPRPSARGRGSILRPSKGEDHSPTSEPSASGEKSRKPESAKSHLMKVGLQIEPDIHFALKKLAATRQRKLYELLNEALAEYLDRQKEESR